MRHLPDLRAAKYFIAALAHKKADFRQVGICGLGTLYEYDLKLIEQLTKDKSAKVANAAARTLKFGFKKKIQASIIYFPFGCLAASWLGAARGKFLGISIPFALLLKFTRLITLILNLNRLV